MRFNHWLPSLSLCAAAFAAPQAVAAPITYTFSGTTSGSLNGTDFTTAPFEFTLITDTTGVFQPLPRFPNILNTQNAVLSFTVNGVSGVFTDPFHVFLNGSGPRSSAGLSPAGGDDLLDITGSSLAAYDLRTSFGPLAQARPDFLNIGEAYATSLGDFVFANDPASTLTFQANVGTSAVPEPGAATLLMGMASISGAFLSRHRRQ